MYQYLSLFGRSVSLYDLFNQLAIFAQAIVAVFLIRQFRAASTVYALMNLRFNKKAKNNFFWRWGSSIILVLLIAAMMFLFNNLTGDPITMLFLHKKADNFFPNIFVGPYIGLLTAILVLNSPLKTLDLITPIAEVALIFYKLSCFFWGCCYGVEWAHGMYNHNTDRREFPVQLVELGCAVVMFVILMILAKRKKKHDGTLYPLFMIMYSGSRFISEFWRGDYPAVLGKMTGYHISCIVGLVEGVICLFVILRWGDRITAFFEGKYDAILKRYQKKYKGTCYRLKKNGLLPDDTAAKKYYETIEQ